MSCREFERALDVVFGGGAAAGEGDQHRALEVLERHSADCPACSEWLALARLPEEAALGLVGGVLERTSRGGCGQAEATLNEFVTDQVSSTRDSALMEEHLAHCRSCSDLANQLERLGADLPRLAVVEPGQDLVASVLRRTLPLPVRLRRWWSGNWPRWVRRPRFSAELSFAATLVLVVILALPGSPLQAMPERALGLVRTEPLHRLGALPERAGSEMAAKLLDATAGGKRAARSFAAAAQARLGTISDEVASWFVTAEAEASAQDQPTQEKP